MSQPVFIGYEDDNGEIYGYSLELITSQYNLLKKIAEKLSSEAIFEIDEIEALSMLKDKLVQVLMRIWELEGSYDALGGLSKLEENIEDSLDSFRFYYNRIPQMEFLLNFCLVDHENAEYNDDGKLVYEYCKQIYPSDEEYQYYALPVEEDVFHRIKVPPYIINTIDEWISLEGRQELIDIMSADQDNEITKYELLKWWQENIFYFTETEYKLTAILFRALRNNLVKSKLKDKPILTTIEKEQLEYL